MFQVEWYFYAFFALIAIYQWIAYFAYLYEKKGRKGLVIGGVSLLIAVVSIVIIYKQAAVKKTKRLTHYNNTSGITVFICIA